MLQRYNVLSDKHVKEPVRVVAVNESMSSAVSGPGMGPVVAEGTVGVHISGMEADVVDTVPNTMSSAVSGPGMGPVVAEGTVGVHISGMEADVVDTVPKTMQAKASRLMEDLKRDVAWTARGELIHEGVPIEPTYGWRRRLLLLVEHRLLLVLLLVVHDHSVGHPSFIDVVGWNIPCPPHPRNAPQCCGVIGWLGRLLRRCGP